MPEGHSVLSPICIHPLASPTSSHSSFATFDDDPFWGCELLQPPSRTTSAATSLPAPSSPLDRGRVGEPTCDLRQRLMNILNFTTEPGSTPPPQVSTTSYDPDISAGPPPHRLTHTSLPRITTMLSPLAPAHAHKNALPHTIQPSPLSAMAFAAPVPRLPLASVLRELDASWAPRSPEASAPTNGHAHSADATQGPFWDVEKNQSQGLGLVLGAACLPIQLPLSQLDFEPQSPPRYSRRLRSLAPAPLQLASPTPRAPLRTLTQAHTPAPGSALRTSCSAAFVDIQLGPKCASAFADAVSVSPQSERRTSASSTMASWSTAPTSLVFPGDSENMVPGRSTNPSQLGMLSWQRSLDTPSSAFPPKSANAGPSVLRKAALTPLTSPRKSNFAHDDPFTPGLPLGAAPPPLRRTEVVPLPELTNEELPPPDFLFSSPLDADLWLDLGVEDLVLRAENCSETIARASMSLCSCSLLRDPKSIANLCDKLRATFTSVQRALDGTPAEFSADGSDAKGIWYAKHWQVISSLDRNLNLFYLLARQIEDRPPRIHRLAPLVDKLSTYQSKFADLARRIVLSHEKLRFLGLRNQLSASHAFLRAPVDDARVLRHTDARAARQEGRARRREIREEITRVRGRIRAIRERDAALGPNDENMSPYDEDEDKSMNMVVDGEKRRRGRP